MELCHSCRQNLHYISCEDCGNLSIDPAKPFRCLFCSNPKSSYYYRSWIQTHPEDEIEIAGIDWGIDITKDAEREKELCDNVVNNYTCPNCGNKRCNTSEPVCWSCGQAIPKV
jgi:predicted RNA-binding Zn-ribbon protein involved in translation (DUF1610 family)